MNMPKGSSSKREGKYGRKVMYSLFILMSFLQLPLTWLVYPNAGSNLFISGAIELAFAFYAVATGNSTYSMSQALRYSKKKNAGSEADKIDNQAEEIIKAGRWISAGAIILVLSGIVSGIFQPSIIGAMYDLTPIKLFLCLFVSLASMAVGNGAWKLHKNISFGI